MFWKILGAVLRTSVTLHKSVTAIGAATIIIVGVYDHLKKRNQLK